MLLAAGGVVLADRLKNPNGRGIIGLYLSLLEAADAAALAGWVALLWLTALVTWVRRDA